MPGGRKPSQPSVEFLALVTERFGDGKQHGSGKAFAAALGRNRGTVAGWLRGNRPQYSEVIHMAEVLGVSREEMVHLCWPEQVGDPCPCGNCPATKVLPLEEDAYAVTLRLERVCAECHRPELYDPNRTRRNHRSVCDDCSKDRERAERITLTCECGNEWTGTVAKARSLAGWSDDAAVPWVCESCLQRSHGPKRFVEMISAQLENQKAKLVAKRMTGKDLSDAEQHLLGARIPRNPNEARQILRLLIGSAEKQGPAGKKFHEAGALNRSSPKPQPTGRDSRRMIVSWAHHETMLEMHLCALPACRRLKPVQSAMVRRQCLLCGRKARGRQTETCSCGGELEDMPVYHQGCSLALQLSREELGQARMTTPLPEAYRPPGGESSPHNLARDFNWAIRRFVGGEKPADIANEMGLTRPYINKRTDAILQRLPHPTLIEHGSMRDRFAFLYNTIEAKRLRKHELRDEDA